ncbi:MAG TPA: N-formylglutamate amidohydrolase [Stellaceae bacterium]|nr:N-formylglutamate amidohydrolase [Stellaceae bacterium]
MALFELSSDDPPPLQHWRENGAANVILACDHASNRVPRALAGLGLGATELERHIAWDIGAAEVTRRLAVLLDAPAILAGYSRLVIDCNRGLDDASSIPETSDGVAIPGNRAITRSERGARQEQIFAPYHAALERSIAARIALGRVPAFLSIHSFTPVMGGKARPWHVGILWDGDPRIPQPLLAALRADAALVVGDNEPYSAREPQGYTVRTHAVQRGLPHVAIELRQDLIADDAGAARWAGILRAALAPILARADLYRVRGGG